MEEPDYKSLFLRYEEAFHTARHNISDVYYNYPVCDLCGHPDRDFTKCKKCEQEFCGDCLLFEYRKGRFGVCLECGDL